MKTTMTITLDSKEVRAIIAKALDIPIADVKPMKYNFAVEGHSPEEIEAKIKLVVRDL